MKATTCFGPLSSPFVCFSFGSSDSSFFLFLFAVLLAVSSLSSLSSPSPTVLFPSFSRLLSVFFTFSPPLFSPCSFYPCSPLLFFFILSRSPHCLVIFFLSFFLLPLSFFSFLCHSPSGFPPLWFSPLSSLSPHSISATFFSPFSSLSLYSPPPPVQSSSAAFIGQRRLCAGNGWLENSLQGDDSRETRPLMAPLLMSPSIIVTDSQLFEDH
ncbi:hypothetical protein NC653_014468 [Populus alba x Populus x berolinensis]|uniref:Transmembrane protein n=1 Tax=Populus alba x Populus x berolinensis TaxID=444605 RepID=A0AAD6W3X1_9ROSI|nr:hypothetical protein NC653_014468 [Populus alba x Populus x berolinensis]